MGRSSRSGGRAGTRIKGPPKYKQRTREHVLASVSYHWLALRVAKLGHATDVPANDYGTDCTITTFDPVHGEIEPDFLRVQLKATDEVRRVAGAVAFKADMRDLRDWVRSALVTVLVVFDASTETGWWIIIQDALEKLGLDPDASSQASKVLHLPSGNVVDDAAVETWRIAKNEKSEGF